ncbi:MULTISPECIES: type II and III secretion system protein family protein [Brevundimonas]|uniref:type II and III secretion system protein family protein n=1 Tax=Brevundimonas TaxID=41275 RepID=UPI000F0265F8|nr:type II and III secretion system protein family protein [Brevundimonas lutea]
MSRTVCLIAALAVAAGAVAPPTGALAQPRVQAAYGVDTQSLNLPRGRSAAIDLPVDARDVIISNPAVAEAMLHSPRRITVIGIAPGETDAVFLDAAGRPILNLSIRVDAGVHALSDTLARLAPGANVRVEAVNESLILTGTVSSPGESDRVTQIARQFVEEPERVINMLNVSGSDQVMLRVKVVEVQRNVIKQLGVDISALIGDGGDGSFRLLNTATFGIAGSQLGGGGFTYNNPAPDSLTAGLRAFERAGLVRTLAEPNLTATNGENADFLAGGEFPVPTGRDREGNIQIEFKPYGVRLAFRPIVLSEGRISLQLSTEVSELTTDGAFTLGGTAENALVIPALNVRRTQTTVEMPSGSALMISGLLREQTRQTIDGLPGLGSVPVIGGLFRSRDYLSGETELVFIVEPYVVSPTAPGRLQTPADGLEVAHDAQTLLLGQLNRAYGPPAGGQPVAGSWQGPVGYVIE